jgi:hypothetical protein
MASSNRGYLQAPLTVADAEPGQRAESPDCNADFILDEQGSFRIFGKSTSSCLGEVHVLQNVTGPRAIEAQCGKPTPVDVRIETPTGTRKAWTLTVLRTSSTGSDVRASLWTSVDASLGRPMRLIQRPNGSTVSFPSASDCIARPYASEAWVPQPPLFFATTSFRLDPGSVQTYVYVQQDSTPASESSGVHIVSHAVAVGHEGMLEFEVPPHTTYLHAIVSEHDQGRWSYTFRTWRL